MKVRGVDLPTCAAPLAGGKIGNQLQGDGRFFKISADGRLSREDPAKTGSDHPTLGLSIVPGKIHGDAFRIDDLERELGRNGRKAPEENRHVTHVNYFWPHETAEVAKRGLFRREGDTAGFGARRPTA